MWRSALALVMVAGTAHADVDRTDRRLAIGLAIPDELYVTGHDVTVPLPTLHVGYAITAAASLELGLGGVPIGDGGRHLLGHVGARYRLTRHAVAPFVMARIGAYDHVPDEGTAGTYTFGLAGGGLEYVRSRLALWLDVGAGVVDYRGATLAVGGSLGISLRL